MTLLKFDGFEGYSSPADAVGTNGIVQSYSRVGDWSYQTGRNNGKCSRFKATNLFQGIIYLNVPIIDSAYVGILGFAMKHTHSFENTSLSNPTCVFGPDQFSNMKCYLNDSGVFTFGVWTGSFVESGTIQLNIDQWYYVEMKFKCNNTVGIGQFRLDEQLLIDFSGDTKNSSTSDLNIDYGYLISGYNYTDGEQWVEFDDVYIADDQGTENNDFLGDIRIDVINPNGAGNYSQLTPSAGNNYECIDETGFDESDYVEGITPGNKDSYTYASVPTDLDDTAIYAVQIRSNAQRTAPTDNIKINPFIRTGSTDYSQTDLDLGDSFRESQGDIIIEDPSDSGDWTQAKINACEFGMEVA
jgi:hypothetical protein